MYNNRVKNIELPENLFSNLGELKSRKIEKNIHQTSVPLKKEFEGINYESSIDSNIKLTNYSNRKEYRNRINKMYEDINDIVPIDNEIDNVLYFNNYVEKGIVIKPRVSSLKQFWTEYRLINNEKTAPKQIQKTPEVNKKLDNFDDLFEALSMRVAEINKYIDELKEMKESIDIKTSKLEEDKERLSEERQKFLNYKKSEETKLKEEKENLKINFERLQTIINDLDKKLIDIDK